MVAKKRTNLNQEKKLLRQRALIAKVMVPLLSAEIDRQQTLLTKTQETQTDFKITKNQELHCNETDCHTDLDFDFTVQSHDLDNLKLEKQPTAEETKL